jgi:hypothetical protein
LVVRLVLLLALPLLPPLAEALPPAPPPPLGALLEEAPWAPEAPPLPAFATAAEHRAALVADPQHHERFWVSELVGEPTSRRVVFLIPQFHRSPLAPLGWTSLGGAIREVQGNIDALVTRLALAHGVRCVGTEGSWLTHIKVPDELAQPAHWAAELERRRPAAAAALVLEGAARRPALDQVHRLLTRALKDRVALYDGAGAALFRLEGEAKVQRFGLEDEALNKRALALLGELQRIDAELAELDPGGPSAVQTAMGRMWLDEVNAYEDEVLGPLEAALQSLDEERLRLLALGVEGAAEDLGRFTALAKHVTKAVLRPDEVRGWTRHYRRVARASDEPPPPPPLPPTPRARKRKAELDEKRAPLLQRYEAVSSEERERLAAAKVLARTGPGGTCALIMGAAHKDTLKARLLELGGEGLAVLVVAPYSFDTAQP